MLDKTLLQPGSRVQMNQGKRPTYRAGTVREATFDAMLHGHVVKVEWDDLPEHPGMVSEFDLGAETHWRCLSLWQVWASLVVLGLKKNETRAWPLQKKYISLVIHAAAKPFDLDDYGNPFRQQVFDLFRRNKLDYKNLPYGAAVGMVDVVSSVPTEHANAVTVPPYERAFGDYSPGRFFFQLVKPRVFDPPIPLTGHQKFWMWQPEGEELTRVKTAAAAGRAFPV